MHHFAIIKFDGDLIGLRFHLPLNDTQITTEVVICRGTLQGKVQILGVAGESVEEAQCRAAVKGQRDHGTGLLQRSQNAGLQIFARQIAPLKWRSGAVN